MRLLLDESVPIRLKLSLPEHDVTTVVEAGWSGKRNGALLRLAADQFEAFITVDKNLQFQQNIARLPIAVVVLDAPANDLPSLLPLVPALKAALQSLAPCTFTVVK